MSKGASHLEHLFALYDKAENELSEKWGAADFEELKTTFKKVLVIAATSLLNQEISRICQSTNLGEDGKILRSFITAFVMEEEDGDAELTDAFNAYLELREARNEFAHQPPGSRSGRFDAWSVREDVKARYDLALKFLPKFERKAKALTPRQQTKAGQNLPASP